MAAAASWRRARRWRCRRRRRAQAGYPDHAIRLVGGFPPGGPADLSGRMLAQSLSESWASRSWSRTSPAPPATSASQMVAEARARRLHPADRHLDHEHRAVDLRQAALRSAEQPSSPSPISRPYPMIIVAPADGAKTIEELVALAAQGTGQAFLRLAGQWQPDPHGQPAVCAARRRRGAACALSRLGAGHAGHAGRPACLPDRHAGSSKGFIDAGRLRILAVCTDERMAALPDVPTVKEKTGFPLEVVTWYLIFAPAGTPQPIVDKLSAAINQAIKAPADRRKGQGARHGDGAVDAGARRRNSTKSRWPCGRRS